MARPEILPEKNDMEDLKFDTRVESLESITKDLQHETHDDAKRIDGINPEEDITLDQYVSGLKLWIVLSSTTLVLFLMLLDMSIVATVSV
jgi:hypothetical protein